MDSKYLASLTSFCLLLLQCNSQGPKMCIKKLFDDNKTPPRPNFISVEFGEDISRSEDFFMISDSYIKVKAHIPENNFLILKAYKLGCESEELLGEVKQTGAKTSNGSWFIISLEHLLADDINGSLAYFEIETGKPEQNKIGVFVTEVTYSPHSTLEQDCIQMTTYNSSKELNGTMYGHQRCMIQKYKDYSCDESDELRNLMPKIFSGRTFFTALNPPGKFASIEKDNEKYTIRLKESIFLPDSTVLLTLSAVEAKICLKVVRTDCSENEEVVSELCKHSDTKGKYAQFPVLMKIIEQKHSFVGQIEITVYNEDETLNTRNKIKFHEIIYYTDIKNYELIRSTNEYLKNSN